MKRALKAKWGEDITEDLGGSVVRKPVVAALPTQVSSVPSCNCSCKETYYKSAQDEEDELTDSWNGDPAGTNRRQRELCSR